MPDTNTAAKPVVYQLRIALRGISPLIWRRVLVRGDSTIADLHRTLQVAFGWSDEHLHRFVIHGREHGTESLVDPRGVYLTDLELRSHERFLYEYDFTDGWQHDVRVEQILFVEAGRVYPRCVGGRRRVPPRTSCSENQQTAPDQRADAAQDDTQLVHDRLVDRDGLRHRVIIAGLAHSPEALPHYFPLSASWPTANGTAASAASPQAQPFSATAC
jgi:hypothetical protein